MITGSDTFMVYQSDHNEVEFIKADGNQNGFGFSEGEGQKRGGMQHVHVSIEEVNANEEDKGEQVQMDSKEEEDFTGCLIGDQALGQTDEETLFVGIEGSSDIAQAGQTTRRKNGKGNVVMKGTSSKKKNVEALVSPRKKWCQRMLFNLEICIRENQNLAG